MVIRLSPLCEILLVGAFLIFWPQILDYVGKKISNGPFIPRDAATRGRGIGSVDGGATR